MCYNDVTTGDACWFGIIRGIHVPPIAINNGVNCGFTVTKNDSDGVIITNTSSNSITIAYNLLYA